MIPLVVNTPEAMVKLRVVVVTDESEKTFKALHRIGVLHVEQSEELTPLDREAIEKERAEVSKLLTYADDILSYLPKEQKVSLSEGTDVIYARPFNELHDEVVALSTRFTNLQQRTVGPSEGIKRLSELKKYLEPLARQMDPKLKDISFSGRYLFSRIFSVASEKSESLDTQLKNYLPETIVTATENETVFFIIGKVEDLTIIESLITEAEGRLLQIPDEDLTLREFLKVSEDKIHHFEQELTKLNGELLGKINENLDRLVLLKEALSAENDRLLALEKACEAKYVTLIEGWIPEANIETTTSELKGSADHVFIDTRKPQQSEEPPTKLRNLKGVKPFQVIVNLFGTPKYGEWDPTPIVAYSFAFFFGLMAGDVVYALGIILLARFLLPKLTDNPETEGFKLFQRLLYISGSFALVVGLLTGSYLGNFFEFFGIESLALAKGIEQMLEDPLSFIMLALAIGFIHVNIGHVLALVRSIKEKKKVIIPNKIGLFLLQICGIPYVLHSLLNVDFPMFTAQIYTVLGLITFASLILVISSSIIEKGALGAIFWLFDVTGLLGDIMSYCRIAGVGLATYYLAVSFNLMAGLFSEMIPGVIGTIIGGTVGIVILVFGHLLNLLLALLASFIHSLRLCFVEFLFKFYEGGGTEYSPFQIRTRATVLVKGAH